MNKELEKKIEDVIKQFEERIWVLNNQIGALNERLLKNEQNRDAANKDLEFYRDLSKYTDGMLKTNQVWQEKYVNDVHNLKRKVQDKEDNVRQLNNKIEELNEELSAKKWERDVIQAELEHARKDLEECKHQQG